eukprot:1778672-Karenia_brevis.AAC.1
MGVAIAQSGSVISFNAAISACSEVGGHRERLDTASQASSVLVDPIEFADFNPQELDDTDVDVSPAQGVAVISFNAAISA